MPEATIKDDFYPNISIYRNFRQSPESVVNRYRDLLSNEGFSVERPSLLLVLSASRDLYQFLSHEANEQVREYETVLRKKGRPIRGTPVVPFDLAYAILAQTLEYVRNHPRESLETVASLTLLEDFIERKAGKVVARIFHKIATERAGSAVRKRISRLSRIRRKAKKVPVSKRSRKTKSALRVRKSRVTIKKHRKKNDLVVTFPI